MTNTKNQAWRRKAPRFAITILSALVATGLGLDAPQTQAMESGAALAAHATTLRPSDKVLGDLPSYTPIHVVVALKLRNRDKLDAFIASGSGRAMAPGQLDKDHLPAPGQAQAVSNFLRQAGFTNIQIADNRLLIEADATAGTAENTFDTTLVQVKTADGRIAFANSGDVRIPPGFADTILSVVGLQTVHQPHTTLSTQSRQAAALGTQAITGHNPTEFSSIYGGSGVPTAAGVPVGIITQGSLTKVITDLNTFTSNNGLATVTTQTVQTGSTSSDTSGDGEWDLDSQDIVGMGGGSVGKLIFYNMPTLANTNLTSDVNTAVSRNETKIINMSLGECETYTQQDGSAAAQDQSFATAVAQGQTFSISTGDSGADECDTGGTTPSWPAASQYVVAVAGTTLNASTTTWTSETVWSGSGGSQSTFEPKPSWQTLWSGSHRGVADVAFDADPNSGAKVIVHGANQQIGGTSLAAPLFAGLWARMIAAKGSSIGFAGPQIYQLPSSVFHDVTSGSNGISAGVGYDLASGRGSMVMSSVLSALGGGGGTNNPPTANFSFTTNGLAANFTDGSSDSDGTVASRSWTFGDGGTSTATNPSHTYAAAGTYSVQETVTDNDGATDSVTKSVTVATSGGNVLQNGVGVSISDATRNHQQNWTMQVPSGATNLVFTLSGGSGDADLYVKFGSAPTTSSYDCRPYVSGNNETCTMSPVQAGTYYVMVNAYAAYSGVTLKGSYTAPGSGGTPTANFTFTTSGLTATFTDTSTDSGGTIGSHAWTFGDGGTSSSTNPSHTYASAGTYSVSETVTDSVNGHTSTKTSSVTVASSGGNALQNGVGITIADASSGHQQNWTMTVPAGATNLVFTLSGGSGDADLYVKFGSAPTLSSYDCRPYVSGNSETCTIANVQAGTYYVMVNAYAAYSGVTLKGSYSTGGGGGCGGTVLCSGTPVTGLAASSNNWSTIYTMVVPSGQSKVTFTISGSSGDADLYVRIGAAPTTSSYSCRPYLTGDNETCTFNSPTAGTYYVGVRAYSTYSGVTLTGTITP